ncbi:hypothetical protein X739_28810 [Mesorhizobium sp. LNHC220B00]|nr:hypothetical protein [Mesorhizobium sp. LNHC220B00]ESY80712.1 hypothetical protein X739_28810 [Mesorhizobium sp. LNHC220B00]
MTHDEVLSVLGPVDEATVAEIVTTGAPVEELREALAWFVNDEALIGTGRPMPGTRIAALIEMLEPEEELEAGPVPTGPASSH